MIRKSFSFTICGFLLAAAVFFRPAPAAAETRPYLHFCGANGTIFGSTTLLNTGKSNVLLDCGLFQEEGYPEREVARRNRFLPFSAREIDYVLVSHAHGDHIGRIPLLVRHGFTGKIYCTKTTAELSAIMLRLMQWIMSQDNSTFYSDGQVERAIANIVPCEYHRTYTLPDGLKFRFLESGHILGSAMTYLEFPAGDREYSLLYTGDIGNPNNPLLRPQETVEEVDILISESTYGNRLHNDPQEDLRAFREIINETVTKGGKVIIPSYVLDRTQNILYTLNKLIREGAFDRSFNVYVDSEYANRLTGVYRKNSRLFNDDIQAEIRAGKRPLSFPALKQFPPRGKINGPAVILAPSGMATVGAVREHLTNHLSDPASTVIFVGFQADGSLGKEILDRKSLVRIDKKMVPVRASSHYLSSFSGHADYRQIGAWLNQAKRVGHIFIIHGQPDASEGLAEYIQAETPFKATVPKFLQKIYLDTILPEEKATEAGRELPRETARAAAIR
ncbi:MAG: MBL fold metallo-hydrolase [Candidatus Erginobacter occultus]|nr:MBL fold metallo-hydrolase [Candidatus Erginobacter occultus]